MRAVRPIITIAFLSLMFVHSASAQFQCSGSLKQDHFHDKLKVLNQELQLDIIDYRKLERDVAGLDQNSEEAKVKLAKMAEVKAKIEDKKVTYKLLNDPLFPDTRLIALGAACHDKRWIDRAKDKLIENPKQLGKLFYVWMDHNTREIQASEKRPDSKLVAQ